MSVRFMAVPGEPDCVLWQASDGACGISRSGEQYWDEYQAYLDAGNELQQPDPIQIDIAMAMQAVLVEVERVNLQLQHGYMGPELGQIQIIEAKEWLADNHASTPFIDGAMLPWEDKREFCQQVVQRHGEYAEKMGELIAWRRIAEAAVEAYFAKGPRSRFVCRYPEVPHAS
ncbi:hypothetical protein [Aeromonas veronii]|uniref:hypothetical protein n=1 Tax=Aeromonas veronii TaxID=654 RepID=UPI003D199610